MHFLLWGLIAVTALLSLAVAAWGGTALAAFALWLLLSLLAALCGTRDGLLGRAKIYAFFLLVIAIAG